MCASPSTYWVAQYDRYEPVPGFHVNGALTLGENVADNSGLAIAYRAYKISLAGKSSPVIDGLTGEQRFYYGWAQVWCGKSRVPETIRLIKVDPHAPQEVRGLATLRNQPGFYEAFDVMEGDRDVFAAGSAHQPVVMLGRSPPGNRGSKPVARGAMDHGACSDAPITPDS